MYFVMTAPAFPVFHLFICQHGVAMIAPVNGRLFLDRQTPFIKQFEKPLGPFIIVRHTGNGFPVPIIRQAQRFQLTGHIGNILQCPFFRRNIMFNCRIFRRHAKRIVTHRMQHVHAPHRTKTGHYVANRIITHMPHMQIAGRIRKHFQHIRFRFGRIRFPFKCFVVFPILLPFRFYGMGRIFFVYHYPDLQILQYFQL